MVEVDVSTQQLFLSERLFTVVARVRLLSSMGQDVGLQVALVQRRVRTQFTAETFLSIVRLQVNLPSHKLSLSIHFNGHFFQANLG